MLIKSGRRSDGAMKANPVISAKGVVAVVLGMSACLFAHDAGAQAIDGAWANQQDACSKVFVGTGDELSVAKDSDLYGSGFVIKGNRIRGNIVTCTIKSRKTDGAVVHVHAVCSTDVALQDMQFSFRPETDSQLIRLFPGMPELDRKYYRCPF
jgi:hypothetical protein